jgi:hypothetical protein
MSTTNTWISVFPHTTFVAIVLTIAIMLFITSYNIIGWIFGIISIALLSSIIHNINNNPNDPVNMGICYSAVVFVGLQVALLVFQQADKMKLFISS